MDSSEQPHIRSVAEFFSATKHSGIQVCEAVNSIRRIASNVDVFVADRERIIAGRAQVLRPLGYFHVGDNQL